MPGGPKHGKDAILVLHLAAGVSVEGAAKIAGMAASTAYRRLANPAFRQRVEKARADFWDRAAGVMSKAAAEAAIVLRKLLRSEDGRLKLQAARTLLEQGVRVKDLIDFEQRLATLERAAAEQRTERRP
jgi:hypothetical protein